MELRDISRLWVSVFGVAQKQRTKLNQSGENELNRTSPGATEPTVIENPRESSLLNGQNTLKTELKRIAAMD